MSAEGSRAQKESQHSTEETKPTGEDGSRQTRPVQEVPDVTLDVPTLNLEEAHLQVENLRARISLQAELADMVRINVGVDAFLEKVELDLKGLEAQALLKANLENVREVLIRTLESLDDNPRLLGSLAQLTGDSGNTQESAAGEEAGYESAGEAEATDAARRKAEDLGVDLARVEGTGSGGRIIVRDVQRAARQA